MNQIIPVINTKELQEKANEFAQKGAIETLKDFYMGYNSPYTKALKENLEGKGFDNNFELPDVIASINDQLTIEIDKIANTAISKTFIPLATKFLTRANKEMKLSEILKEVISISEFDVYEHDWEDYSFEITDSYPECDILRGSFLNIDIHTPNETYNIRFNCQNKRGEETKTYTIVGLPRKDSSTRYSETMKISLDGVTLEMPFTKNVLNDPFTSYIARLLMAETKITLDVTEFEEDMFPEREHCHC